MGKGAGKQGRVMGEKEDNCNCTTIKKMLIYSADLRRTMNDQLNYKESFYNNMPPSLRNTFGILSGVIGTITNRSYL